MLAPDYGLLFTPIDIGPVRSGNRFLSSPHGVGYGHREPEATIATRRMRAEGGWGIVCTEQTEIHASSDMAPYLEFRNWDEHDLPVLAATTSAIHMHDALAALELSHSGCNTSNLYTRETSIGPSCLPILQSQPTMPEPYHARAMSVADIDTFRGWHRAAAARGVQAGFDIIYVCAMQLLSLPHQFLSRTTNFRTDAYGGSLKNRARLLREVISDTKQEAGERAAVAVRLTLDHSWLGAPEEWDHGLAEFFREIGALPDLWDITFVSWNDLVAGTGRFDFKPEHPLRVLRRLRDLTDRPLVANRLFDSLERMAELVADGTVDLVGAARQSIADPFLPTKLRAGRPGSVRRCIKCNFCVAGDLSSVPVRCTQNPAFGEEWRRGWHPEQVPPAGSRRPVLIVGGGVSGLECARVLGRRGYEVTVVESREAFGGRALRHSRLAGFGLWEDLIDYRLGALRELPNVIMRPESTLSAATLADLEDHHLIFATGASWRRDGFTRSGWIAFDGSVPLLTPDDVLDRAVGDGSILLYDDDHDVLGGALAEKFARAGIPVTYVTPAAEVSVWTHKTMEQACIQTRLLELGVRIVAHRRLIATAEGTARLACVFTGRLEEMQADRLLLLAARTPNDGLLLATQAAVVAALASGRPGPASVAAIGEALCPAPIAQSVRSGFRAGLELDGQPSSPLRSTGPLASPNQEPRLKQEPIRRPIVSKRSEAHEHPVATD